MRLALLAVLFTLVFPARAQSQQPFTWPTAVIHRVPGAGVSDAAGPFAAASDGAAAASELDRLRAAIAAGRFQPGSAVSIEPASARQDDDVTALMRTADEAGVHVVAELDPGAAPPRDAGFAAIIVRGDPAVFQEALEDPGVPVASSEGPAALIVDPPPQALAEPPDWDAVFNSADPRRVTRLRPDVLPPAALHGLMLMPGGLLIDGPLDEAAAKIESFRLRHPAVGAGRHDALINSSYTFRRSLPRDDVVVVFGASGKTSINVSRVFPDDSLLRDALTGRTAFVSFGMATFEADPSGIILIEELR